MENIILIMADQFRGDMLGVSGNPCTVTPNIDNLAGDGCYFENGYSPSPTCVPARACLITGKKPATTGFFSNDFSVEWEFDETLMQSLKNAGYQTINVGKNHFHPLRKSLGFEQNYIYEVANDEKNQPSDYHRWLMHETNGQVYDTAKAFDPNAWTVEPWTGNPRLHPTEWTADKALDCLDMRDPTRPFYLQVSFQRPHPPLDPPVNLLDYFNDVEIPVPPVATWAPEFVEDTLDIHPFEGVIGKEALKRARKAYYAAVMHIDEQVGKIISYLHRHKLWDSTTVFFVSDHGELLGDHNMFRKGPAYEGSSRIPYVVKFSKGIAEDWRGKKVLIPVTLLDVFPTCATIAEAKLPEGLDGLAIQDLLSGNGKREYIFGENYRANKQVRTGGMFVVGKGFKYIWNSVSGVEQLFDLRVDRKEMHDLSEESSLKPVLEKMRKVVIEEYRTRPYDGMLDENGNLASDRCLPAYRKSQPVEKE